MKTLAQLTFLSFFFFFLFLINPKQIFAEPLVQVVFWITGPLNFLLAVLVFDKVGKKNDKIIDLQNQIQSLIKEDNEIWNFAVNNEELRGEAIDIVLNSDPVLKIRQELALLEEQNKDLRLQLEDLSSTYTNLMDENRVLCNSNNWLRIGLTGIAPDNLESPHGALK